MACRCLLQHRADDQTSSTSARRSQPQSKPEPEPTSNGKRQQCERGDAGSGSGAKCGRSTRSSVHEVYIIWMLHQSSLFIALYQPLHEDGTRHTETPSQPAPDRGVEFGGPLERRRASWCISQEARWGRICEEWMADNPSRVREEAKA